MAMQEGGKAHRIKKGKAHGHLEEAEPVGPTCTITHIYSWKWMKVEQDDTGEVDYVRSAEFEEA